MRWYRNLKTMTKLMLGFALMGALLAGLGWFSIDNIARVNANVEIIYQRQMLPIISLQTIAEYRQQIRGDLYRAITTKDDAEMKELINGIHSRQQEIVESEKKFEATIVVEEVREAFKKYLALTKDFVKYQDETIIRPLLNGDRETAMRNLREATERRAVMLAALRTTLELRSKVAEGRYEESQAIYASSRTTLIGFVIGGILLGLALGFVIARQIVRPLSKVVDVMQAVTLGDMTKSVGYESADEVGQLATATDYATENMRKMIAQQSEATTNANAVKQVLEAVSKASTPDEAATVALDTVKSSFGWAYGSYWTVDAKEKSLRFSVESGTVNEEFRRVTLSSRFREGEGLSGRAWRQRDLFFTPDIGQMTDCTRAPVAQRAGVKSGVCFPILVQGQVVGTMDFFSLETLNPSKERLDALRAVGGLFPLQSSVWRKSR